MCSRLEKKKAVEALLADDRYLHLDIVHVLENEDCSLLHLSRDGVVVRHACGTVFAASFSSDTGPVAAAVPPDTGLLDVHDEGLFRLFSEKGYEFEEPCYLFSYHGGTRDEGPYSFRTFTKEDLPVYAACYGHGSGDEEELRDDIARGDVVGILDEGELMGFAGFHKEGSMGMLEVFPGFRRRRIGTYLLSHLINLRLERGQVPFCNVYLSNEASIRLQRSLGMHRASGLSYWMWK